MDTTKEEKRRHLYKQSQLSINSPLLYKENEVKK